MKTNDVILHMVTKVVVFIILTLAIYLFLAGHNQPGGGFIAGLVLSSAFVLLFLAFDMETVQKGIPVNFLYVAATGVFLVVTTGLGSLFMKEPFLTQVFTQVDLPLIGVTDIGTMMLFEAGVALAVVGVVITIILGISEDV
ncbi:Na(+)/H(+) antiporter subunit B [Virgibacillus soli]|uniref:Na(+)/H(+) antiporter subunit B n=1 Tax=Paracerasibacillus soli TaxID=480284 RepID=UPI0035EF5323